MTGVWLDNQIFLNEALLAKKSLMTGSSLDLMAEAVCYNSSAYP